MSRLRVEACVVGSEASVVAGVEGALRSRRAYVERCLSLDGARLSTLVEAQDDGVVSCVGREVPAPAPAGRALTSQSNWWDGEWQERAYRTLIGETPDEARWFPGGWVPVFTCPCGDPWCLYTAVKQSTEDGGVTWHEMRMVSYRDIEVPGRRGRTRTATSWEPPELGPNLLPAPFSVGREDLAAALLEAAAGRPEWQDGEPARPREWAVAGVPAAATSGVTWLRAWDRPSWRLARTGYSRWEGGLAEQLDRILAEHDPLRLRASGLVDSESYEGVSEDLGALMPPLALAQHAAPLLADYFAQVWGLQADPASLSRVGDDVFDVFGGFSGAQGWESTRQPSLLRRRRRGSGGERA